MRNTAFRSGGTINRRWKENRGVWGDKINCEQRQTRPRQEEVHRGEEPGKKRAFRMETSRNGRTLQWWYRWRRPGVCAVKWWRGGGGLNRHSADLTAVRAEKEEAFTQTATGDEEDVASCDWIRKRGWLNRCYARITLLTSFLLSFITTQPPTLAYM